MSEAELVVERHDAVLVARLNRPDARNALSPSLMHAIGAAVVDAEGADDIRALVLTGTGDRAFCAGMDLRAFASGESMAGADDAAAKGFFRLLAGDTTVPVIGAANATAMAGGFELLLACDIVVASADAKFGLPEAKRALYAAGNGTLLGTRVPLAIALELNLLGDSISAARAYELGLVNAVVAPSDVLATAIGYGERIAANGPLAVTAIKELVRLAVSDPARAAARRAEWQPIVFGSDDAKEGALAFVEKRAPVWRGR